jgi:hypothetical protein
LRITGLSILPLLLAGCADRSDEALEGSFETVRPAGVKIVHFEGDFYKDPSFLWETTYDPAFLAQLVKSAGLRAATPADPREAPVIWPFPAWWNRKVVEALPECYLRDPSNDSSFWRIWADRESNRMFLYFQNN